MNRSKSFAVPSFLLFAMTFAGCSRFASAQQSPANASTAAADSAADAEVGTPVLELSKTEILAALKEEGFPTTAVPGERQPGVTRYQCRRMALYFWEEDGKVVRLDVRTTLNNPAERGDLESFTGFLCKLLLELDQDGSEETVKTGMRVAEELEKSGAHGERYFGVSGYRATMRVQLRSERYTFMFLSDALGAPIPLLKSTRDVPLKR